ncbi:MAG: hypothetical protein NTY23_06600 [Chloroflexi bacterium]|nr:hypothetical protein [Chloroflexota bacterium]
MTQVNVILELIGYIFRPVGFLVFGVAAGWLASLPFTTEAKWWQLEIAALLGLLGSAVTLSIYSGAGTVGAYALGAGASVLFFGLRAGRPPSEPRAEKKP